MAIIPGGILSGPNGTVGAVITYNLNGQIVMRGKRRASNKAPSLPQLQSRMQMGILTLFVNKMKGFIKTGFGGLARGTTLNYHNLAIRYNKNHATIGEYPDIAIAYDQIILSKGNLEQAINPAVARVEDGLKFTWDCPSRIESSFRTDQVMMLAYSPEMDKSIFIDAGARRRKEEDFLILPSFMQEKQLEVYIAFVANDRLQAADSMYLGSISPV